MESMVELAEEGVNMVCMICVTHEMGFARQIADRVVFMDQSQILEMATPDPFFGSQPHERAQAFLGDTWRLAG